jgi:hypothetical protein
MPCGSVKARKPRFASKLTVEYAPITSRCVAATASKTSAAVVGDPRRSKLAVSEYTMSSRSVEVSSSR